MKTYVGLDGLVAPRDGAAITIGTFDGVHVGHRALISTTVARARELGVLAGAITWDRHPNATLRPERLPPLLSSPERKMELLAETELDFVAVLPFTKEFSQLPAERFVAEILADRLAARAVVVGEGWRFGHKAKGNVELLSRMGRELGLEAHAVPLIEVDGQPMSSSRARATIQSGDVELARVLLGRPFDIDGVVVRGDDRGMQLGWPTANVMLDSALVAPPRGVYAGRARAMGSWYAAAINLGTNPTFSDDAHAVPRIEAYLLDFNADLYGRTLRVEFHARLRDEKRFESADELVAQIARDVDRTRELIGSVGTRPATMGRAEGSLRRPHER